MTVTQDNLDAGLRLAIEGNRNLVTQMVENGGVPASGSAGEFDTLFEEESWPSNPGRQPFSLAPPLICASTWSGVDLARLLQFAPEGGGILTASLLTRYVLESAATGAWILSDGYIIEGDEGPADIAAESERSRRSRIERAHVVRWKSMNSVNTALLKDKERVRQIKEWEGALGERLVHPPTVPGRLPHFAIGTTDEPSLGRMCTDLEKLTFAKGKRPRLYDSLSGYSHPNVDIIATFSGDDGRWQRDFDELFHHLWVSLTLVSTAWEILAAYAGWGLQAVEAWKSNLGEINLLAR